MEIFSLTVYLYIKSVKLYCTVSTTEPYLLIFMLLLQTGLYIICIVCLIDKIVLIIKNKNVLLKPSIFIITSIKYSF